MITTICTIAMLLLWTFLCAYRRATAIALLVILLPTYQMRYTFFGFPTTLLELCIVILGCIWLINVVIHREKPRIPHAFLLLFFIAIGAFETLVSMDVRAGLGLFKAYIFEPVLVYVIFVNTITNLKAMKKIHYALLLLVLIVSIAGFLQVAHVIDVPEPYASEHPQRVTSVYSFPTAIGKLLGPLVAFALASIFVLRDTKSNRWLYYFSMITVISGSVAILLSVNRGALLGLLIAGIVIAFFSRSRKLIIPVTCLFLIASLLIPLVQSQIGQVLNRQDTSTDVRIVMWKGTLRLISSHPIIGAGLGGFPKLYDIYRDPAHVELFPNPDQLVLTVLVELGLGGLLAFSWIFIVWIRACASLIRQNPHRSFAWIQGVAGIAALIALTVHGMVDTPYFKNDLAVAFWIVFGLITVTARISFQPETNNTQ